jgi:hypothetical protein
MLIITGAIPLDIYFQGWRKAAIYLHLIKKSMTPEEKAKELFNHYHNLIQSIGGELGQEILVSILAKQCALFLARETLQDKWNIEQYEQYHYWVEVEYQIENTY